MDESPKNLSDCLFVIDTKLAGFASDPVAALEQGLEFTFLEGRETHCPFPHTTGWRTLPFSVFSCPLDHFGAIEVEGRSPVVIQPGEGFLLPTGVRHKCDSPEAGGMRALWMHFSIRMFGGLDLFTFMEPPGIIRREEAGEGCEALREVIAAYTIPPPNPVAGMALRRKAVGCFLIFLANVCRVKDDIAQMIAASQRVQPILAHIQEHYADDLNRDFLARMSGLSRSHFHRLFRQATGTGVMEHLKHRRLQAAQTLLLTTEASVQDIAAAVGFGDAFHFTRQFTTRVGCSPRAFRKWRRPAGE